MTTTTTAQSGGGSGGDRTPTSTTSAIAITNDTNANSTNTSTSANHNNDHILTHQMPYRKEEDEGLNHQHLQLGGIDDDERRFLRGYTHHLPHQQSHGGHPQPPHHHVVHHHPHHLHHHPPPEIQTGFDHIERDYARPMDLGYVRGPYSPGGGNGSSAAAAAAAAVAAGEWVSGGGHEDWMDVGGRGSLIWPDQHNNSRYHVPGMKWETSNGRPASEGGMSSKSKLCSPGSGYQGVSADVIPGRSSDIDDTLAQLSVKELNKRVSNLPRDEVVALKQRRRTLKNRGYAMNCRLRRQETKEKLEIHVKLLEDDRRKLRCENEYLKARCDKLQQQVNQYSMAFRPISNNPDSLGQGGQGGLIPNVQDVSLHPHFAHHHPDQLHHGHNQPLQLDMPRGGPGDFKKYSSSQNQNPACDLKRNNLSRL